MRVVLDANVVFSGAGWRGEAFGCLLSMARRKITTFATSEILEELRLLVAERGYKSQHSPQTVLSWYYDLVKLVEPVPLGKRRSRDPADDPYLACALGCKAKFIITRDNDLLTLKKPFGVEIITPRELLMRMARQGG